jgi:hypothetical protein
MYERILAVAQSSGLPQDPRRSSSTGIKMHDTCHGWVSSRFAVHHVVSSPSSTRARWEEEWSLLPLADRQLVLMSARFLQSS